jgi:hypothetical protein
VKPVELTTRSGFSLFLQSLNAEVRRLRADSAAIVSTARLLGVIAQAESTKVHSALAVSSCDYHWMLEGQYRGDQRLRMVLVMHVHVPPLSSPAIGHDITYCDPPV